VPKVASIKRYFKRLRVQITLYMVAIIVLMTGTVLAISWRGQAQVVSDRLSAHVEYVADATAVQVRDHLGHNGNATDGDTIQNVVSRTIELEDMMALAVVLTDGTVLAEARGARVEGLVASPFADAHSGHRDVVTASSKVALEGEVAATVYAARSLSDVYAPNGLSILPAGSFGAEAASFQGILVRNALVGLAILALAIPVVVWFIGRATRGISAVTRAANELATGNLSVAIQQSGAGEVVELQDAFRKMQSTLRENIEEISALAFTDTVTELPNRRGLQYALREALVDDIGSKGALFIIDLDHFKGVNDTHGHQFGDQVLKAIADRLKSLISVETGRIGLSDWLLARFGGDEFALLLRGITNKGAAASVADRLVIDLEAPIDVGGMRVSVGCSIGFTDFLVGEVHDQQLLQQADLAMYAAKRDGRRRARSFSVEISDNAKRAARLENDLREAIRNDELIVHYQPIMRCDPFSIAGAEALVRWHHPVEGFVPPSEFVPIAEDSGLIGDLGNFVLNRALADFRRIADEGHSLFVSVNVAAAQVTRRDFAEVVTTALERSGVPAQRLKLELTESSAIRIQEGARDVFKPLKELGVQLAADDFGTGHSSLGRLPEMPFDVLKIDQSFVASLSESPQNQTIVDLITALARRLGLSIVAEGVEDQKDFEILRAAGVQYAQGFLWSPALRFSAFQQLARTFIARPAAETRTIRAG